MSFLHRAGILRAGSGVMESHIARGALPPAVPCLVLALLLTGCSFPGLPSQRHPSCSWQAQIPPNQAALCAIAFATVSTLVRAEVSGNDRTIRRLVTDPAVARRIIAYGRQERRAGIIYLRVGPSLVLGRTTRGLLGVGLTIAGKTHHGNVSVPETVYLRVRGRRATVSADQPDEEW